MFGRNIWIPNISISLFCGRKVVVFGKTAWWDLVSCRHGDADLLKADRAGEALVGRQPFAADPESGLGRNGE